MALKVLLTAPCISCKAPVRVVRRPLRITGMVRGPNRAMRKGNVGGWVDGFSESKEFSVAVVLDSNGDHFCRKVARAA